jgi:hypothetical protein
MDFATLKILFDGMSDVDKCTRAVELISGDTWKTWEDKAAAIILLYMSSSDIKPTREGIVQIICEQNRNA